MIRASTIGSQISEYVWCCRDADWNTNHWRYSERCWLQVRLDIWRNSVVFRLLLSLPSQDGSSKVEIRCESLSRTTGVEVYLLPGHQGIPKLLWIKIRHLESYESLVGSVPRTVCCLDRNSSIVDFSSHCLCYQSSVVA